MLNGIRRRRDGAGAAGREGEPSGADARSAERARTTSYPRDDEGPPARADRERTSSYQAPSAWSRRGYDAIN